MNTASRSTSKRLAEVVHLTTDLSDRVLMARLADQEVSPQQLRALVEAAMLLQERGEPWPPLLTQALHELSGATNADLSERSEPLHEPVPAQDEVAEPMAQDDERGVRRFLKLLKSK